MCEENNVRDAKYWKEKYDELRVEYLSLCEDNQNLNAKLEKLELDKVCYEDLESKCRHYEMLFTDAERNRQIIAAQMDIVYLIFGKKN